MATRRTFECLFKGNSERRAQGAGRRASAERRAHVPRGNVRRRLPTKRAASRGAERERIYSPIQSSGKDERQRVSQSNSPSL
jgi:hypothetical protein